MGAVFDLAICGGGINGCGIARDAAGRGLSVVLCEQHDLAGATSSASTKLIHGGLRYLEHYEFRLVREALREREVLLHMAPHIIWPLRFILPHHRGLRPAWLLRLGLFLYDHLGTRKILPPTRSLRLDRDPAGAPLKAGYRLAFEYSDCWVDDARLVVLNARDAAKRGASIRPRTRLVTAKRDGSIWRLVLEAPDGQREIVAARMLINAAGPWVASLLKNVLEKPLSSRVRLVQGSHIVVRRVFEHDRAYIFQNADGRIVFAIPYLDDFTLIGTTDQDYTGDPAQVRATPAEIAYLCRAANEYFRQEISPADVVWNYSGVRPLYDDGASTAQEATRDYVLELDAPRRQAPLLSVFGGKITTYRRLAEAVLDHVADHMTVAPAWTAAAPLPGGDMPHDGANALAADLRQTYGFLTDAWAMRLVRAYGTDARVMLEAASGDPGRNFGHDLTEMEVDHLIEREWASSADDVLWRRSKLGLRLSADEAAILDRWIAERRDTVRLARRA
ncbi:glycerol-3-phosphate dehydrogenase [Ferrovibrio sp.]|uniref:glycerol-3-phosphate dehydrogenase n=1 Tax=Ferrovibrio sp. TaxID=1917215 RepID=UPI0026160510|nr:glycerol-3-phosphate dehydrogenase [Ferrovibrio sp.]